MREYVLSACSTADLSVEKFQQIDVSYICFHYELDGEQYPDDLGKTIAFADFYERMKNGAMTKTSQVNVSEYIDYFTPFLEAGKDIVHLTLSSGISGTVNSARNAANILEERFPERKIYIVDSLAASSGYGLLVSDAADKKKEGMSAEELVNWIEENKLNVHHWFFSTDLSAFVRGGRISKTSAVFGGLLEICPLMNVDYLGRLIPRFKIRTKKKVIKEIAEMMKKHAVNGADYDGKCYMSNSACEEDALAVAAILEDYFPNLKGKIEIYSIGTTIGAHTGPGTVALFFWGDKRVD